MMEIGISLDLKRYRLTEEIEMACADGNTYKGVFIPYKPNGILCTETGGARSRFIAKKERNPQKTRLGCTHFLMLVVSAADHAWLVDNGLLSAGDRMWSPFGIGFIHAFEGHPKRTGGQG